MAHTPEADKSTPDVQTFFPWNGETMQFAEAAYRSFLRGAETVQTQAMEYWSAEVRKSIEAMNQMAQCQTAAEAFGVQTRFATEAMQDLMAESQKVVERIAALTQTPWAVTAIASEAAAEAVEGTQDGSTGRRSSRRRS
ncbi:MAG TPA: phasin family protein [Casimicrobiaceae bacterium]|nr:phasin family protein [Casimicrobiaceae bacterium]